MVVSFSRATWISNIDGVHRMDKPKRMTRGEQTNSVMITLYSTNADADGACGCAPQAAQMTNYPVMLIASSNCMKWFSQWKKWLSTRWHFDLVEDLDQPHRPLVPVSVSSWASALCICLCVRYICVMCRGALSFRNALNCLPCDWYSASICAGQVATCTCLHREGGSL